MQEYWSGLSFPPPGSLPNPGIESVPPAFTGVPGKHLVSRITVGRPELSSKTKPRQPRTSPPRISEFVQMLKIITDNHQITLLEHQNPWNFLQIIVASMCFKK